MQALVLDHCGQVLRMEYVRAQGLTGTRELPMCQKFPRVHSVQTWGPGF
jgi:hypothetical protein